MHPDEAASAQGRRVDLPSTHPSLDEKVAFLRCRKAYPPGTQDVAARETHMSWVFMVGDRVYKLKKPVRFPYLDFSTLARREAACRAEFELNRRLAPDVYLGVVPLTREGPDLAIGGPGEPVDWLVLMRRLDERDTLESALLARRLTGSQVDRVAATLGMFFRHAPRIRISPATHLRDWRRLIALDHAVLSDARFNLPRAPLAKIVATQERFLKERPEALLRRVYDREIIDSHGDLRPEHIWVSEPVTIIDRLEFDPKLRALDPLEEVAFLHLECERLGAAWAGERLRRRLAGELRERPQSGLFLFYRIHRAMLRARLAIAHLLDEVPRTPEKWPRVARTYLKLAARDAARLDALVTGLTSPANGQEAAKSSSGCRMRRRWRRAIGREGIRPAARG